MTETTTIDQDSCDAAAVAASLAGTSVGRELTWAEKTAVAKALTEKAFTPHSIALHLGDSEKDVRRMLNGVKPRRLRSKSEANRARA